MQALAPEFHLRASVVQRSAQSLGTIELPVIALRIDGSSAVLVARDDDGLVAIDPSARGPRRYRLEDLNDVFSGRFVRLREGRDMPEIHRMFGLSWLTHRASRFQGLLIQILVASLLMQVFATAMPLFSQIVIDKVLVHHNLSALYVLGVGMGLLTLFEFLLMLLRSQQQAHIASKLELELGLRIKRKLVGLPLQYFQGRTSGHVLGLFRELDAVRQFITGSSATSLVDVTFLVVFLPLMYFYSPVLTGITVLTALAMMGLSFILKPGLARRMADHSQAVTESQSRLVENMEGIGTIKALAAEPAMQRRWESAFALNVLTTRHASSAQGFSSAANTFIQRASTLGILWVGADLVLQNQLSVGQMIAFQMLSARVLHPMMRMSQLWQDLRQVEHSMSRLGDIMNAPGEEMPGNRSLVRVPQGGDLALSNVRFSYPGTGRPVLDGVTLSVPFGHAVALVGRSGSGKSTLVKLLIRLHDLEQGRIAYNHIDIRNIELAALRNRIALVPQDTKLFDGTIADNIAIHCPWISFERVVEAARHAVADEFIDALPDGYQTKVGSQGVQLSGGQRQRIALARAILDEPDVLILDEATSALDYATEVEVQDRLSRVMRGRTLIVITHRLEAVRHVDAIHMMVDGKVVESGTHAALMARRGPYCELFGRAPAIDPGDAPVASRKRAMADASLAT